MVGQFLNGVDALVVIASGVSGPDSRFVFNCPFARAGSRTTARQLRRASDSMSARDVILPTSSSPVNSIRSGYRGVNPASFNTVSAVNRIAVPAFMS